MRNNILRQSEPYGFLLERELQEMKTEGYDEVEIIDSINELIEELEIIRNKVENGYLSS